MKAYVFSIGESTTELCCELMKQYGFEVVLFQDNSSLWDKLKRFYKEVLDSGEEMAVRIDADIIPNKHVQEIPTHEPNYPMWQCSVGYDWYKQDRGSMSIHYMNKLAIRLCWDNVERGKHENRPETFLWRQPSINLYTRTDWTLNRGLHGYGQKNQRERIKALKASRNQDYDWDLVERIEAL